MALDSNAFLRGSLYCLDHISNNMLSWHFKLKVYTVWWFCPTREEAANARVLTF